MFQILGKILTLGYLPLSADGPDVLAVHVALLDVHGLDELHGGGDAAAALSLNLRHQLRPCGKWNRKLNGEPVERIVQYFMIYLSFPEFLTEVIVNQDTVLTMRSQSSINMSQIGYETDCSPKTVKA